MERVISESASALQEAAREFAARHLLPLEPQYLAGAGLAPGVVAELEAALAAAGLDRPEVPESSGGRGLGFLGKCLVQEELSYSVASTELCLEENLQLLLSLGSGVQLERYAGPMERGELRSAFALTEPDAGSDPQAIRTTAARDGTHYVMNGHKAYIRGLTGSLLIIVLAWTDTGHQQGLTAWLVDRHDPAVRIIGERRLFSVERVSDIGLTDCRLLPDRMLGGVGQGWAVIASRLERAELLAAARCNGIGRRCLDLALQHVQRRTAHGGPLAELQIVQHQLAERATELHAARLLTARAAARLDAGHAVEEAVRVAKTYAAEAARRIADTSVQLHGAQGGVAGTAPEFLYRASRLGLIAALPTEIHRVQIAQAVLERWGGRAV